MDAKSKMPRIVLLIIILVALLLSAASWMVGDKEIISAQANNGDFSDINPTYEWGAYISRDGRFNYDRATGMAVDASGNLFVLSVSSDASSLAASVTAPSQIYISKIAKNGILDWQIPLDTSEDSVSYAGSIALDNNGNIYITGYCEDTSSPFYVEYREGMFVAKFDSSGSLLWNTTVEIPDAYLSTIAVDANGSVYIVGERIIKEFDFGTGTPEISNFSLAKVSTQGKPEWIVSYGDFERIDPIGGVSNRYEVATDANGFVVVVGEVNASWGEPIKEFFGRRDIFVAKFDNTGALIWNTFLGINGSDRYEDLGNGNSRIVDSFIGDVEIDNNGEIYLSGESASSWGNPIVSFSGNEDSFLAKVDSNGNLRWNTFFGAEEGDDNGMGITLSNNNSIYVVGNTDGNWGNPIHPYEEGKWAYIAEFDTNGILLWNSFFRGSGVRFEMADDESLYFLSDYNYFFDESTAILGTDYDGEVNDSDLFVAKLNLYGMDSTFREPGPLVPELSTHIPTPGEVSREPEDILANLSLAAFLMLPFAIAVDVFSRMVSENEESLGRFAPIAWIGNIQKKIASSTIARLNNQRIKEILRLLVIAAFYGLVFSLLDPTWQPFSTQGVVLFIDMVIASGLVGLLDDILQWRAIRKWGLNGDFTARPTNVFVALTSTAVSRVLSLSPGLMFGSPEAVKIDEASLSNQQKGHLLRISMFTYLGVGLLAWLPTDFMNAESDTILAGAQAMLLVIYMAALENTFVQLIGLSDGLGTRMKAWNKWGWAATLGAVAFWFLYTLLDAKGKFMEELQKGNVPVFIEVTSAFIVITFLLHLIQRYRKNKRPKTTPA